MTLSQIKTEQKILATHIRSLKNQRKTAAYGYVYALGGQQLVYRARHIIYCLLRGRKIEQIEIRRKTAFIDPTSYTEYNLRVEIGRQWSRLIGDATMDKLASLSDAEARVSNWYVQNEAQHEEAVCVGA